MLTFHLPDGRTESVEPTVLLNAGYAGRNQAEVAHHIAELAELGVPAPTTTPSLYAVSPYLAQQTDIVSVQHGRTSGEAEWGIVLLGDRDEDVLLVAACDHTDRELERHGVAWSKNASPDVLSRKAWRLIDIAGHLDRITMRAWVGHGGAGADTLIQDGTVADLLDPFYWLDVLAERGLKTRGTVLISGTISMLPGVDQFVDTWRVELGDPTTGDTLECGYRVAPMPAPIG
ncbi:DUF2848 domain-containing protein [Millisia brevis]|uniref:DUF2848 domain-containing protein n=1 Tax=Millisia brevis TaxID=264148 RepID=UPI00083091E2|nr:DUF2848 domain-containing protein [Millisia brevis]